MSLLLLCERSESIIVCLYGYFTILWYFIAMPSYMVLMIALVKYRNKAELKTPFFKLLFSIGLMDILSFTSVFLGNKMLHVCGWIWFLNFYKWLGNNAAKLYSFISFFCGFGQAFHVMVIAVNRMTAMTYPFKHKMIWREERMKWIIVSCWAFATIIAAPILTPFIPIEVGAVENSSLVETHWISDIQLTTYIISAALYGLVTDVALIVLYSISFHSAYKRYKLSSNTDKNSKDELTQGFKMVLAGFVVSAPLLVQVVCMVIWRVAIVLGSDWSADFWYVSYGVTSDMYGGLNPFVIVILSKSVVRKYVKEMFGIKDNKIKPSSTRKTANSTCR